ncbi:MAG: hypothetical protein IJ242_00795 [Clostridia bacterium]|nr:hypothetical protein [Clostridia bacterium]
MEQYELIWEYQQVDMELEQYEKEMRNNTNRKELIKYRDFLLEQQGALKKIETEVDIMGDRLEALVDEVGRLNKTVNDYRTQLTSNPPDSQEKAKELITTVEKLVSKIGRYETEIAKLRKDSEARDRQQREVRVRAAKARAEFDRIKAIYDEEYKEASKHLEVLKNRVASKAIGINKELLDKYTVIKRHSSPPITKIREGRCGGCNMQLPAADMNSIRTGSPYVECENCGRIILVK